MPLWGKNNNANNAPKYTTSVVSGKTGTQDYGNTVIYVQGNEGLPVPPGWAKKTVGTGNRSGRTFYESLVVFGGISLSYIGQVATKSRLMDKLQTGANTANVVNGCYLRDDVNGNAVLVLAGWYWDRLSTKQELSLGGITYTATVEYNGTRYPVTWGGQSSVVVTGLVEVESDPIAGLVAPSGSLIKQHIFMQCAAGIPFVSIAADTTVGDVFEYGTGLTDKTVTGTPTQTLATTMYAPIAFIGPTKKSSVLMIGDSIFAYFNDDYTGGNKDLTFARCFGSSLAYINAGSYGDTSTSFIAGHDRRVALKRYCTHVPIEYGVNDASSISVAQMIANRTTMEGYFSDKKVYNLDIVPKTSSTDSWLTTANQTVFNASFAAGAGSDRGLFNAAQRAKPNYIQFGSFMETAQDSGIWKADGTAGGKYTTDGLHPWKGSWIAYTGANIVTPSTFPR